jgi:hypothetical protein
VGATDIDPFVINIAQGGVAGLSIAGLCAAILIAASSNNIAKAIYALGFGGIETSRRPASLLFILAMLGFACRGCLRAAAHLRSIRPKSFRLAAGDRTNPPSAAAFANLEFSAISKLERSWNSESLE